jgi:hypothetical protein
MNALGQINPIHKSDGLLIASLVLGLTTLIFPIISVVFLIAAHGGPGYIQSLVCGIPFAVCSIIAGTVSLVERRKSHRAGNWMAVSGILMGSMFFVIALILVFILLLPFLSGTA